MAFRLSIALALFPVLAAAQIPFVAERPVSVPRIGVPASAESFTASLTSNGDGFLVSWNDWRAVHSVGSAMRLDATGQLIDEYPIAVPLFNFRVVWGGGHWVALSPYAYARIGEDGQLLDPNGRPLDPAILSGPAPRSVWTGSKILAAFYTGAQYSVRTYDPDTMQVVREVTLSGPKDMFLGFVSNGRTALLVYRENTSAPVSAVHGALFDAEGELLWDRVILLDPGVKVYSAGIASSGGDYFVVFSVSGGPYEGFRLTESGQVIVTIPKFGPANTTLEAMTWDGAQYTAYFRTQTPWTISAVRIGANGTVHDLQAIPVVEDAYALHAFHAAARPGTNVMVYQRMPSHTETYVRLRVSPDVKASGAAGEVELMRGAFLQQSPAAASSSTQSLVAWRERITPNGALVAYASRISHQGEILDPQSIVIANETCDGLPVAVASDGRDFLVAWRESKWIWAAVVRENGSRSPETLLGTYAGTVFDNSDCRSGGLAVASNGSGYLVAWVERVPSRLAFADVRAARVAADGSLIHKFYIGTAPVRSITPLIASDGDAFVVGWDREFVHVTGQGTVDYSLLVSSDVKGLAWNGSNYILTSGNGAPLRLTRLGRDGRAVGSVDIPLPRFVTHHLFRCDATQCLAPLNHDRYETEHRLLRVTDAETLTAELVPVLLGDTDGLRDLQVFGGPRLLLSYVRCPREAPFSGAARVFVRGAATRQRSIRH